jgi:hypothetical protein
MYDYLRQFPTGEMVVPEAATEGCADGFAANNNSASDNIARNWAYIWPAVGGISAISSGTGIPGTRVFLC